MFSNWTRVVLNFCSSFLSMSEFSKAWFRVMMKNSQLTEISLSPNLSKSTHVVVTLLHNEAHRLPYFLKYYREMGFNSFIFIDNNSQDNSLSVLQGEIDCTIFAAHGSYKNARFGVDWVNAVLNKHCDGKWILHVDADEFLCFPQSVGRFVTDLTAYLEEMGAQSMNCLLLDLYSKNNIRHNHCEIGKSPFDVLRYYDATGYVIDHHIPTSTRWIKGGVRGRRYFEKKEWEGPALNKTPLVRWKRSFVFLKSAHQMWPFYLNKGSSGKRGISGVLLHAKFLNDFVDKIKEEQSRRQHSAEYDAYIDRINMDNVGEFYGDRSRLFEGWRSLVRDGLMSNPLNIVDDDSLTDNPFQIRVL